MTSRSAFSRRTGIVRALGDGHGELAEQARLAQLDRGLPQGRSSTAHERGATYTSVAPTAAAMAVPRSPGTDRGG
jgi:hypothetical protein